MSYQIGTVARIRADFTNLDGVPTDPTAVTVEILAPDGTETTPAASNDPTVVGGWYYDLPLTMSGIYRYRWVGTGVIAAAAESQLYVEGSAFSEDQYTSTTPPCQPWITPEELPCIDASADELLAWKMVLAASSNLYELSNRKFPGICEKTVTACSRRTLREVWRQNRYGDYRPVAVCGCHRADQCGCSTLSAIRLPQIVAVSEVLIDSVEVDPEDYRVDGGQEIVSLGDPWPCCDVQITYTTGRMPPADGVVAAGVLACELILAASPDTVDRCRLPKGVTSIVRNGIQITIKPADLQSLFEVANFLEAHNPKNLRGGPAIVLTPDVGRMYRRIGI